MRAAARALVANARPCGEIIVNADIPASKHIREDRLEFHFDIVTGLGSGEAEDRQLPAAR
jgi:hypothetical protein